MFGVEVRGSGSPDQGSVIRLLVLTSCYIYVGSFLGFYIVLEFLEY